MVLFYFGVSVLLILEEEEIQSLLSLSLVIDLFFVPWKGQLANHGGISAELEYSSMGNWTVAVMTNISKEYSRSPSWFLAGQPGGKPGGQSGIVPFRNRCGSGASPACPHSTTVISAPEPRWSLSFQHTQRKLDSVMLFTTALKGASRHF